VNLKLLREKLDKAMEEMTPESIVEFCEKHNYELIDMKNLVPELKETKRVLDAYFKVDEQIFTIKKDNGTEKEISRLRLNRPDAVAVLIFNEEEETMTFVRQYRPAIGLKNDNEPIVEIAAGIIDEGENPEEAAKREVLEETGYKVENLEKLHEYYPGVGYCSERTTIYIARVKNEDKIEEGGGLEVEGEMMEIVETPVEMVYQEFDEGNFVDGKTIIALQEFRLQFISGLIDYQDEQLRKQEERLKDLETKIALIQGTPKG
jgi:GDP-mannose pyrophosphatase NudK